MCRKHNSTESLATAFEIVEAIVARNGAEISELAAPIDRPKSTVYDHILTLQDLTYLVRAGDESTTITSTTVTSTSSCAQASSWKSC